MTEYQPPQQQPTPYQRPPVPQSSPAPQQPWSGFPGGAPAQPPYDPSQPPYYGYPGAPLQQPPAKNRKRLAIILSAAGVVIVAAVVTVILVFTGGPAQQAMTIKFGLFDADDTDVCTGGATDGYSDIQPGMPVTVRDENNKIIASTDLPDSGDETGGGCIWTMHVKVPVTAQQYAIEGGRRGTVTFSRDQLVKNDWTAEISVGQ